MTKCSIKNCKNHCSIQLKKDGVTYHRFPQNYVIREKWRKLVAKDRNDEYFKPHKSSVICSRHFSESDMYLTKKGFKRLKKTAIPQIKIHRTTEVNISNLTQAESSVQLEQPCNIKQERSDSDEMDITTIYLQPVKTEDEASELPFSSALTGFSSAVDSPKRDSESSSISSGVSSVLDSPRTAHFKNELKKCHRRLSKKDCQIRNLNKKNKRLLKRNFSLKELVKDLKKKRLFNESLCRNLKNMDESVIAILSATKKQSFSTYPQALRKFALTVHCYSPAAYQYLRRIFNKRLPHPSTLSKWFQVPNVQAEPDLTAEVTTRLDETGEE